MAASESITIQLVDLDNIIQLLAEKKFGGGVISIVDLDDSFNVRDDYGMLIGTVKKTTE